MEISTILDSIGYPVVGIVLIICSFIKIPKLELNLWNWLGRGIGRCLNHELYSKVVEVEKAVTAVDTKIENHIQSENERDIKQARERILRVSNELNNGIEFDEEFLTNVLKNSVDVYAAYCIQHPDFPNSCAELAMENIRKTYDKLFNTASKE